MMVLLCRIVSVLLDVVVGVGVVDVVEVALDILVVLQQNEVALNL